MSRNRLDSPDNRIEPETCDIPIYSVGGPLFVERWDARKLDRAQQADLLLNKQGLTEHRRLPLLELFNPRYLLFPSR
jgi:hypothetical protein